MRVLEDLSPQRVFYYFEQLSAFPHGSGNTRQVSDYCAAFAREHGLDYTQDSLNDIVIRKPASAGYEGHPTVILQGHLDMVCEKMPDCDLDFMKDGLRLRTDGTWVWADGTTLGGDDGIAVAMALAVLEDDTLLHPPLEAVFTVDEETGMDGAAGLDPALLSGKILLNIDSEDEGIFTVGCAGGARAELCLPLTRSEVSGTAWEIVLDGLTGGHSGTEINKGRQNADLLLAQFLRETGALRIVEMKGGNKDNAIPVRAECTVICDRDLSEEALRFAGQHRTEADPELTLTLRRVAAPQTAYTRADTERMLAFLESLPNGVQAMSKNIEGLVETSLNLGQLKTGENGLSVTFSVRSSVNAEKDALLRRLQNLAVSYGGTFSSHGHYPAWEYRVDSPLRDVMIRVYEEDFGAPPQVVAIHAGVECGFFCDKIPGLDAVSFGPDLLDIHTPRERMNVPSVARTYRFLCDILKQL